MPRPLALALLVVLAALGCADAPIRRMVNDLIDEMCKPLPDGAAPDIADAGVCDKAGY